MQNVHNAFEIEMKRLHIAVGGVLLWILAGGADGAQAQEWREEAPLPQALYSVAAAAIDGDIYVAGGRSGRRVSSALYRYDVAAGQWRTDLPPMEDKRYFAAAAVLDGKIYVTGGRDDDDEVLETVEVYDPRTRSWSEAAELEEARYGHATVVLEGTLYVLGGANDDGDVLSTVEFYDAEDDEWEISDEWTLDQPRTAFSTVTVGGTAYTFGGINRVPLGLVQQFGVGGGTDVFVPPGLLNPRAFVAAVAVGDTILVIGGRDSRNHVVDDVVLFSPSSPPGLRWNSAPRLRTARDSHAAVAIAGTAYVIGGRDGSDEPLTSVESYNASSSVSTETPDESAFALEQNHPNPFTISTRIAFTVADGAEHVRLDIFDARGRLVYRAIDGYLSPGAHAVEWDGRSAGRLVPSGVYFYILNQGRLQRTGMMTRVR